MDAVWWLRVQNYSGSLQCRWVRCNKYAQFSKLHLSITKLGHLQSRGLKAAVYLSVFLLIALDAARLPVDGNVLVPGERTVAVVTAKVLQMPRVLLRP